MFDRVSYKSNINGVNFYISVRPDDFEPETQVIVSASVYVKGLSSKPCLTATYTHNKGNDTEPVKGSMKASYPSTTLDGDEFEDFVEALEILKQLKHEMFSVAVHHVRGKVCEFSAPNFGFSIAHYPKYGEPDIPELQRLSFRDTEQHLAGNFVMCKELRDTLTPEESAIAYGGKLQNPGRDELYHTLMCRAKNLDLSCYPSWYNY